MKKVLFLALCAATLFSCKKEPKITNQTSQPNQRSLSDSSSISTASLQGVSVTTHGFVKFNSVESYEAVLDILKNYNTAQLYTWETTLGFNSSNTVYANPEAFNTTTQANKNAICLVDELLGTIINQHGIVQIGDYVFKAEMDLGRVLEISAVDLDAHYTEFKNGTFIAATMNELDNNSEGEHDNIFQKLATGVKGLQVYNPTPPTPSSSLFHIKDEIDDDLNTSDNSQTFRAKAKAVYQKAVFYFSLMSELKYMQKGPNQNLWKQETTGICYIINSPRLITYCAYKPKKGSLTTPTVPNVNDPGRIYDNKLNWRPYSAGKRLTDFTMDAFFDYYDLASGTGLGRQVRVRTNS